MNFTAVRHSLFLRLIAIGAAMVIAFTALLTAVFSLDRAPMEQNVRSSVNTLAKEGNGCYITPVRTLILASDNWTDAIMTGNTLLVDSNSTFAQAMGVRSFDDNRPIADITQAYKQWLDSCPPGGDYTGYARRTPVPTMNYGRYWHGYRVTLMPMLMVFDVARLRVINYVLLNMLAFLCFILVWRRISPAIAVIFAISLVLTGFFVVPYNLQFCSVYYIMFVAIAVQMLVAERRLTGRFLVQAFFVIGGLTVFFDFLTAPVITLGMPLALVMLRLNYDADTLRHPNGSGAFRLRISSMGSLTMKCILGWLGGYAGLWLAKWVLASLFTDTNILVDAFNRVALRTYGDSLFEPTLSLAIAYCIVIPAIFVAVIMLWLAYVKGRVASSPGNRYIFLPIVAIVSLLWFYVAYTHAFRHFSFVWRSILPAIFSLITLAYLLVKRYRIS